MRIPGYVAGSAEVREKICYQDHGARASGTPGISCGGQPLLPAIGAPVLTGKALLS
jgi:hypothetical protein